MCASLGVHQADTLLSGPSALALTQIQWALTRFLLRQHGSFPEQPEPCPRPTREGDRGAVPGELERGRRFAAPQIEAGDFDRVVEPAPIGLEPGMCEFEKKGRGGRAPLLNMHRVSVDPRREDRKSVV